MWECFNCDYKNVDAAVICAKCRAPKPEPGTKRQGRSFYASQQAAQERAADEVRSVTIPPAPSSESIRKRWKDAGASSELAELMLQVERRQYNLREAVRLLANIARAPQNKGNDAIALSALHTLVEWEQE